MSLSPIGIDIGSYKTVVSVVQNGGVDILLNSYSNRSTPSSLTFTSNGVRFFGEDSKNQSIQNFQTTITQFKHLIKFGAQKHEEEYVSSKLVERGHEYGVVVGDQFFNAVQLYAMFLGSLERQILENGIKIGKCVISVPGNYTPRERELVRLAADIVGLEDVEVLSEALAVGMTYATKNHQGKEAKRVIVDVGYSQMTISLESISDRTVIVEKSILDDHVGGRVIDRILCDKLLEKVGLKFPVHSKPYQRVLKESEKLKKILSANNVVSVNIENVTDEKDIITSIKRDDFEQWIDPYILQRIETAVLKFLSKKDQFASVELIGGSSRIPSIKEKISKGFGVELSLTLNQDEAVCIGDAYLAAAFTKKLEETHYKFRDTNFHKIDFFIGKQKFDNVVSKHKKIPNKKKLEFNIDGDFDLEAREKHVKVGHWKFSNFKNLNGSSHVIVECGLKLGGEVTIYSAAQYKAPKSETSGFSKMFSGSNEPQVLNQLNWVKLPSIGKKHMHHFIAEEHRLQKIDLEDKINKETKNQLESTIYRTRRKLDTDELQAQYGSILDELEDWLYEEGDEAPTENYKEKLAYLQNLLNT